MSDSSIKINLPWKDQQGMTCMWYNKKISKHIDNPTQQEGKTDLQGKEKIN